MNFLSLLQGKTGARLPSIPKQNVSDEDRLIYILSAFPNIGEKRSRALLEKYKTLANVVNTSARELSEILGEKRAMQFYSWCHKIYVPTRREERQTK